MADEQRRTWFLFTMVVLVLAIGLGGHFLVAPSGPDGTRIGGPFTLTDGRGETVTEEDFRGRWMLLTFGYTHCPDTCITALKAMAGALDALPAARAARVRPVFISLDPQRDTPQAVARFVRRFHPRLTGLSGSPAQVAAAARAYAVSHTRVQPDGGGPYLIDHTARIHLMDPAGEYAARFPWDVPAAELARGISAALGGA